MAVALVADRNVGEGLVDAMPAGPGRVVLVRAAVARDVVLVGLRAKGWIVDEVEAYRTERVDPHPSVAAAVETADAVVFTSSSTASSFVESFPAEVTPAVVVSIGPETTQTLMAAGVRVTATADPHTLDGLVGALVRSLS
jgi:uroporphyrinogen-III synthase